MFLQEAVNTVLNLHFSDLFSVINPASLELEPGMENLQIGAIQNL